MLRPGTTYGPNGTRKPLTPLPFSFLRITGTASDTTMKAVSVPMLTISHSKVASTKPDTSPTTTDRKSTRLNSSHTVIYTLSLHDALPIYRHGQRHHHEGRQRAHADHIPQ